MIWCAQLFPPFLKIKFSRARNSLHVFPRLPPLRLVTHFLIGCDDVRFFLSFLAIIAIPPYFSSFCFRYGFVECTFSWSIVSILLLLEQWRWRYRIWRLHCDDWRRCHNSFPTGTNRFDWSQLTWCFNIQLIQSVDSFVFSLKGQWRQLEREAYTLHSEQRRAVQKGSSVSGDLRG